MDLADATSAKSSSLLTGQNHALELAVGGAPLAEVLEVLVHTAETQSEGSFAGSILLMSEDGKHLLHGAAPSLPDAYNAAIDGIAIGPRVGSCGTAAHFGHAIYVTDIARDPLWADFRDLALQHGLRACWSTPIVAKDNSVLGTLAIYYREPRGPSESDREMVKLIGNTAALVIENARLHARLHDENYRARLAADAGGIGFFTWEVTSDLVSWQNERPYEIFGIDRSEPPINAQRFVTEFLEAEDQEPFAAAVARALEGGTSFRFAGRIRRKSDGAIRRVEFTGQVDPEARQRGVDRVVGIAADVTARQPA
ncbi:GAF domain-containing protein [Ramlibacter albus]|nr:GAF domain-containing protein [Ramlibacter albus]